MRLLVSVVDAAEARLAMAGGVDVVDVKNPAEGSLGARNDLRWRGHKCLALTCDVTDRNQVQETIEHVRQQLGPIEILVNNAGTIAVGPIETMTLEDFRESIDTHFWAPLYGMLAVLPEMRRRRQGRIVNISSIASKNAVKNGAVYAATKWAVNGLSVSVAEELREHGIRV